MKKCLFCDQELTDEAVKCGVCKLKQQAKLCDVCKRRMPVGAKICNVCKSYQEGHQPVTILLGAFLAPLLTAIGVLSGAVTLYRSLDRESHTLFKFNHEKTTNALIRLHVWNDGEKPSWLLASQLVFDDPQIPPVPLKVTVTVPGDCEQNLIKGKGELAPICLNRGELRFHLPGEPARWYSKEEAQKLISGRKVTLRLFVRESNDPGLCGCRPHHTLEESLNEADIDAFLSSRLK